MLDDLIKIDARSGASTRRHLARALIIGSGVILLSAAIAFSRVTASLDRTFFDLQTRWLQQERPSEVAIVEIDAQSLSSMGRWPLPRSYHAQVVRNLSDAGADAIFVDIDFSAPSVPEQDAELAAAFAEAARRSRLILPAFWQPTSADATSLIFSKPLPSLQAHAVLGLVNLKPSQDGLIRRVASFDELPAGALPVWRVLNPDIPAGDEALLIDYRQSPRSFARISYKDAIDGQGLEKLRGKTVFVGATAMELGDIVAVPVHHALPGVIVQALAHDSARSERLTVIKGSPLVLAIVVWAMLVTGLLRLTRWRVSALFAAALIGSTLLWSTLAYQRLNIVIPISPFISTVVLSLLGSLIASLSFESWLSWWALRRTRDRDSLLRQVVEHSSDAIIALDSERVIRMANPAAGVILACRGSELVGRSITAVAPTLGTALDAYRADSSWEIWLERPDTSRVAVQGVLAALEWEHQTITTVTLRDVTTERTREAELRHLALHDALTGLPNRRAFADRMEQMLGARKPDQIVALMMLDLDGFKEVNDTLGHSTGDELMREIGKRLQHLASSERHLARIGGDEFALLWPVTDPNWIGELAQEVLLLIQEPIVIKGIPISLGTSIGVAMCPEHGSDAELLLKRADIAMYTAKRKRTSVEFYDPETDKSSPRRLEMLSALRAAVSGDELFLEYQPKVSMQSGAPVEVEALCRWLSPLFGRVSPGEFIPLAEASDLIKPLTEWTIHRTLTDCHRWRANGVDLRVAVNLSARHLQDARLPHWLETTLAATGTRPEWLELEITESAIMTDPERASRILHALHDLGVLLSIDDFGTGYSSLAYLRNLAVDRLKLDRSFIDGMKDGLKDQLIVESTINLAHGLELEVVAEGIETEAQYRLLRQFGCELGQGYWIAKPMPVDDLVAWYRARLVQTGLSQVSGLSQSRVAPGKAESSHLRDCCDRCRDRVCLELQTQSAAGHCNR